MNLYIVMVRSTDGKTTPWGIKKNQRDAEEDCRDIVALRADWIEKAWYFEVEVQFPDE